MKYKILYCSLLCASLAVSGCAFTQANLNVQYPESSARPGPLSSIAPMSIQVEDFTDLRTERDKIGYKRNGFGQQTADIVTTRPVPQILREAIIVELMKNGHLITGGHSKAMVNGVIHTFWFDQQINFFTVEFMGTIGIELNLLDPATRNVLITRTYNAHYDEKSMGGYHATFEHVMNVTLEQLVRQVATDQKLIATLTSLQNE